ncbi:MAG TPA: LysE family translocator [Burkholderiaceae bacterium]|nr:LysE family translocator [Burkholderiaceae bacterium]
MEADQVVALVVFALVGSFTPGPNNAIATLTGANFGMRAAVPHILGVPFGFASMLLAAAAGVAALLLTHPAAGEAIRWFGTAYLLWLAWSLVRATEAKALGSGPFALPLSFSQAALFQYLNPKAWMLAAATAGAFMAGDGPLVRGALAAAIFAVTAFASLVVWAALGASLRSWLAHGTRLRAFNVVMGASLAITALWMLLR